MITPEQFDKLLAMLAKIASRPNTITSMDDWAMLTVMVSMLGGVILLLVGGGDGLHSLNDQPRQDGKQGRSSDDVARAPRMPRRLLSKGAHEMRMSERGKKLLAEWEDSVPTVYRDAAGLQTIGVGHLLTKEELASGADHDCGRAGEVFTRVDAAANHGVDGPRLGAV